MIDDNGVTKQPAAKKTVQKKMAIPAAVNAPEAAIQPAVSAPETVKKTAVSKKTATKKSISTENTVSLKQIAEVSPEVRQKMIEDAAYFKAEKRNFEPGYAVQDWADAEREIDDLIDRAKTMTGR